MKIILHRGNNLEVLKKYFKHVDMIEVDGKLILDHDPHKIDPNRSYLSINEIFKYNRDVILDLKIIQNEKKYIRALVLYLKRNKKKKTKKIYISSFNHVIINTLKKQKNKFSKKIKFGYIIHSAIPDVAKLIPKDLDFISINHAHYFKKIKISKNIEIFAYTINKPEYLPKKRIDGIITDNPDIFKM